MTQNKNLLIITQTVDENDPILGFFIDWIEEFAKYYNKVFVICQTQGKHNLPKNVFVYSDWNNKKYSKLKKIILFYSYLLRIRKEYNYVFVHMVPIYVLLGTPIWKLFKKATYLWYAHGNIPITLKLAHLFLRKIFTASKESCCLQSRKIIVVGHGINTKIFKSKNTRKKKSKVINFLTVGRISPSKRMIQIIDFVKNKKNSKLTIVGCVPEIHKKYFDEVVNKIKKEKLIKKISLILDVSNKKIPEYLNNSDIFLNFSKTGSMDKAVLESLYCGTPVLTINKAFKNFKTKGLFYLDSEKENIDIKEVRQVKVNTKIGHSLKRLIERLVKQMD